MPDAVTGVDTNTLTFHNLQPDDAGEYQCVATCNLTGTNDFSQYATLSFIGMSK